MCGRFANATSPEDVESAFGVRFSGAAGQSRQPRWNIAPGAGVETVAPDPSGGPAGRRVGTADWGMEGRKGSRPLVNARGETMFEKPSFADAAERGRCLVVASGWYEWKAPGKPYFIRRRDGAPMAMAGISRLEQGRPHAVIVTRGAAGALGAIHGRAPLLLEGRELELWLDPASPRSGLERLVRETDGAGLEHYPVSAAVGSAAEDHEGLVRRDDGHGQPPPAQMRLL